MSTVEEQQDVDHEQMARELVVDICTTRRAPISCLTAPGLLTLFITLPHGCSKESSYLHNIKTGTGLVQQGGLNNMFSALEAYSNWWQRLLF